MTAYQRLAKYYDLIYGEKERTIEDCDFLEVVFNKFCQNKPMEIVDICCGTGNHALVLAERGYKIIGIDKSEGMIKESKRKAITKRNKPLFFVQDMRYLKTPKKMDTAICMFNGFGYLTTQQDLEQFFSSLHKILKRNSLFIFEFWNIEGIKPTPYKNWTKRQQNEFVLYRLVQSDFDVGTNILKSDKTFIILQGDQLVDRFEEVHRLKCYTVFELRQLLENNKFELIDAYDFDSKNKREFKEPRRETFRVIAIAKNV